MTAVQVRGITMALDDIGSGGDALLLVHGHPFNRSMWAPQLSALGNSGWRVIAPDLRGYGGTSVTAGKTTLDVFARDLGALLDQLGLARVVVAGLSMGGQIAMEFCRQYPERVRGLLLAATFPQAETQEGRQARCALADRLEREGMTRYAEELLPRMLAARSISSLPEVARQVTGMMRNTSPQGAAAALRGRAERPGYEATLAGLRVPALVVVGSEDPFTTRHDAERMRDLLAQGELVWLDGVGHMPNLEAETLFNDLLAQLLGRIGPEAGFSA